METAITSGRRLAIVGPRLREILCVQPFNIIARKRHERVADTTKGIALRLREVSFRRSSLEGSRSTSEGKVLPEGKGHILVPVVF